MLVQQYLPVIHKKTDQAGQSQCLLPNVDLHVIPDMEPRRMSHLDPHQCNNLNNAKTWRNIGGDLARQVQLPAFAQFV